jgi:phosphoribosylformylglycinamidine synthase
VADLKQASLAVLSLASNASKHYVYRHYDSEVKGLAVLRPGEADSAVICVPGTKLGVATSVDGNPRYSTIDAYLGAVHAVCESVRNVAAVGAIPVTLTDCLNFGNPEDAHVFQDFVDTVRGIGDAARALGPVDADRTIPITSGNVSFYNESSSGAAVPPSPIIACYGLLEDYSTAVGICLKTVGSILVLVGERTTGLGGSALYATLGLDGSGALPAVDLDTERGAILAVTDAIRKGLVRACHDVSEGGLLTALAEMVAGGWGMGRVGADVRLDLGQGVGPVEALFSEGGGFVVEAADGKAEEIVALALDRGAMAFRYGETTKRHALVARQHGKVLLDLDGDDIRRALFESLEKVTR